jgi:hypothetical protein
MVIPALTEARSKDFLFADYRILHGMQGFKTRGRHTAARYIKHLDVHDTAPYFVEQYSR